MSSAAVHKLLIATTNPGKLREIRPLLAGLPCELVTLAEIDPIPEPQENGATFWENARIKALAYAKHSGMTVVAEDSGLEVDALDGEPGVHSARFMGASWRPDTQIGGPPGVTGFGSMSASFSWKIFPS